MTPTPLVSLVHAAGFLTGIALYAMLGWMLLQDVRSRDASLPGNRLPLAAALLGVLWNAGALLYYGAPAIGVAAGSRLAGVIAFSALGFLPAVVVQAAARGFEPGVRRALVALAYVVSTASLALQLSTLSASDDAPDRSALLLLTVGYGTILVAVALLQRRGVRTPADGTGTLAAVGLAVFAVTALHLSQHREGSDSVVIELIGHQGSLPLALVILYQDYRFAFADLFLKRALSLLAVVTLAVVGYSQLVVPAISRTLADGSADEQSAMVIVFAVLVALSYPLLQRGIRRFVDRVVLRRTDYAEVRRSLSRAIDDADSETGVLRALVNGLRPALMSESVEVTEGDEQDTRERSLRMAARETLIAIPVVEGAGYTLTIGPLRAGRRLLSDDLQLASGSALLAARRIDALRAERGRFERAAAEIEVRRLVSEAELRALRAQLDPHFLFNALTTIGHLLTEAPSRARSTLLQLTGLLRAVLRPGASNTVTLAEELEIVTSYLAIEQARLEERLQTVIDVPFALRSLPVPPLLLQPLVENAVKHGIAPLRRGGAVRVAASLEEGVQESRLVLTVSDTGTGVSARELAARRAHGVGLNNVEQRLAHQFGESAGMRFESEEGRGTSVRVWLPVRTSAVSSAALTVTRQSA